jgi:hypothetical protein
VISPGALAARIALGLAAILLAALIAYDGVVGQTLESRPGAINSLAAGDARVLAAAADDALTAAKPGSDLQKPSDLASRALAGDATQVTALRDLGLIAARRGEANRAFILMSLAGRRSPLDGVTHLWLMTYRLVSGDYGAALRDADVLLRHAPGITPTLTPLLIAYAAPARAALEARLAANPPWGPDVLIAIAAQSPDPGVVQAILTDLQATPAKPTPAEWTAYFARRVKDGAYELAYLDWVRTLPPPALAQAKAIYDGDFAGLPGVPPFNWRLGGGLGGQAEREPADAVSARALHVSFDGYGSPELAEQLLVLAPGSYRFAGQARATSDASDALAWELSCAGDSGVVLARAPAPGAAGDWRAFAAVLQVPQTGCAAQWLRLTPSPTDHARHLEVWYRGLAVDRME